MNSRVFFRVVVSCSLLCFWNVNAEDVTCDVGPGTQGILPEQNWNRCLCDTADSMTKWKRWWKYLNMKSPVTMKWLDGLLFKVYPTNEICRAIYVNGYYDPNMVAVLRSFISDGSTFIDVGANCGYISLPLHKFIGTGKIVAIEPSSRDYKRLVENIELSKLQHIVQSINIAVGDRIGRKSMIIASEERSGSNTLGQMFAFKGIEKDKTEDVNVTTLDNIVESENLQRVDVVKLDVEGSEARCIAGAIETVKKFQPVFVIAINKDALKHSKRSVNDIEHFFKEHNYKMYDIARNVFALKEVESLERLDSPIIVCMPAQKTVPALLSPRKVSICEKVTKFFN